MMKEGYNATNPSYSDAGDPDGTLGEFRIRKGHSAAYAALSKKSLLKKDF